MAERRGGIVPASDGLKNALRWLAEQRRQDAETPRARLVDEAALRFDLSPLEVEFLLTSWKE